VSRGLRWQLKSLAGVALAFVGLAAGSPTVVEVATALNVATLVVIAGELLWLLMDWLHE
jgi:hypothetical protein